MKKGILHTVLLFLLSCFYGYGQNNAIYSQYLFNGLVINPAYAGNEDKFVLNAIVKKQWVSVPGSPLTLVASGHSPVSQKGLSLGFILSNDQAGFISQNGVTAVGAYKIKWTNSSLSFGLQIGLTNYSIDYSKITTDDNSD
ncbi:MAG: PorP/SprF family type IX secretion system membrane protein, partial [Cytophagales bacterium]|nr:PorP/SprF family type IX secretion system membrane protein [Cytophagales bacterium]